MKKLICVEDVEQAQADGIALCVDGNTIVTPAAQDLIEAFQLPINKNTLIQLLKMILAGETASFQCEQHDSGLKVVKGESVKMAPFDTGDPNAKVYYQELISKEEAQISAGFLEIDHSSFDWELTYEEIDYVISGTLEITIEGQTFTANPGDVVFVPKDSKVTWCSPNKVKLFYATYPANWPDLL